MKRLKIKFERKILIKDLVKRYCIGDGIEIGPGKNPYGPRDHTVYLDKHVDNWDGTPNADIIADACEIPVPDEMYDYLISSHNLEHLPNTLRALNEWIRVLKLDGIIFVILPHADRTFDRYRAKTTLAHHIRDFKELGDAKVDRSHFKEMKEGWMKIPDGDIQAEHYRAVWGADTWDFEFRIKNDILHYHCWTQTEMIDLFRYLQLDILYVADTIDERDDSFVVVGKKKKRRQDQISGN